MYKQTVKVLVGRSFHLYRMMFTSYREWQEWQEEAERAFRNNEASDDDYYNARHFEHENLQVYLKAQKEYSRTYDQLVFLIGKERTEELAQLLWELY
ncbi:MAG: hypothetical protein K2M17_02365 [Bacilli bacterium]|nr:hypothetical protein [Bacilli bacterium]